MFIFNVELIYDISLIFFLYLGVFIFVPLNFGDGGFVTGRKSVLSLLFALSSVMQVGILEGIDVISYLCILLPISLISFVNWGWVRVLVGMGDMYDTIRGEGYVEAISPISEDGESTTGRLFYCYFTSMLLINGALDNQLIQVVTWVEVGMAPDLASILNVLIKQIGNWFVDILPVILLFLVCYFLVDASVAFVSKFNPEANMLTTSMPIKTLLLIYLLYQLSYFTL